MKLSYHSLIFLFILLPTLMVVYNVFPQKLRRYIILLFNYAFLFIWSKKLVLVQICLMLITYIIGRKVQDIQCQGKDKIYKRIAKRYMWFGIAMNLGTLAIFKYLNFFAELGANFLNIQFTPLNVLIPVGISYYTLQQISYLIDISSRNVEAERSIINFAIYTSFFVTILQGPITRYAEVKDDIANLNAINLDNSIHGYERILFGLFKKVVLADRIAPAVNYLFNLHTSVGSITVLAAVLCTVQLYMDFSGTVDISIGAAKIFGIHLPENFKQPFFAKNATDFWHRWHMTLSRYLRDYVFYPISLSRIMMRLSKFLKKHNCKWLAKVTGPFIALFVVWLCNGLWHGANILFILYGMYYFMLMIIEILLEKPWKLFLNYFKLTDRSNIIIIFRFIKLLIIVCYGEMMCRVSGFSELIVMTKSIFINFNINHLLSMITNIPLLISDWVIILAGMLIIFIISLYKERKVDLQVKFDSLNTWKRWGILYILVFTIILFGAYGPGFDNIAMIYAGF